MLYGLLSPRKSAREALEHLIRKECRGKVTKAVEKKEKNLKIALIFD